MDEQLLEQLQASVEEYQRKCLVQRKIIQKFAARALVRTDLSEIDYVIAELFRLCLADERHWNDFQRSPYLGNREKTRRLGQKLNQLGGFRLMQQIAEMVPAHDQRELEYVWHGIGQWCA